MQGPDDQSLFRLNVTKIRTGKDSKCVELSVPGYCELALILFLIDREKNAFAKSVSTYKMQEAVLI